MAQTPPISEKIPQKRGRPNMCAIFGSEYGSNKTPHVIKYAPTTMHVWPKTSVAILPRLIARYTSEPPIRSGTNPAILNELMIPKIPSTIRIMPNPAVILLGFIIVILSNRKKLKVM